MIDVSVIIPVYNGERHLQETIDSLRAQKNCNCEFIFVNDGSTDTTINILYKNKKDDERIKILSGENKGVSAARNIGLDNASGEYIMFLDSDDLLIEDAINIYLTSIRQHNCDIALAKYTTFNDQSKVNLKATDTVNSLLLSKVQMQEKLAKCVEIQNFLWGKIYKKTLFSRFRFDEKLRIWEDVREMYKLIEQCENGLLIDCNLILYRQSDDSCSKILNEKKINEFCIAQIDKAQFYLKTYPDFAYLHSESMFQCGAEVLKRGYRKQITFFNEFLLIYRDVVKKASLKDKIKYFIIKHNLLLKMRSK